ncbi:MAG: hypothetical protein R3A10_01695 [Caldilineaceae bacterium]
MAVDAAILNALDDVHFGDQLALRGFSIGAEEVIPGQALPIEPTGKRSRRRHATTASSFT